MIYAGVNIRSNKLWLYFCLPHNHYSLISVSLLFSIPWFLQIVFSFLVMSLRKYLFYQNLNCWPDLKSVIDGIH